MANAAAALVTASARREGADLVNRYPTTRFERAVDAAIAQENKRWEGPLTKGQQADLDRDVRLFHDAMVAEGQPCPCDLCHPVPR